ncbi:MAG: hypothetical protein LBU81_05525 [Methanosarcinales archaeon]|jgi:ABC-type microcin C transport system permease subunit YejB|nr:hypothetical protein [Methanosarcinales archaeon]
MAKKINPMLGIVGGLLVVLLIFAVIAVVLYPGGPVETGDSHVSDDHASVDGNVSNDSASDTGTADGNASVDGAADSNVSDDSNASVNRVADSNVSDAQ